MKSPDLSIVILTWNSSRHVGRALASVRRETEGLHTELIVIDNRSSDNSLTIVEAQAPDARIVRNPTNLGVARARNQGVALAAGRLVLFLDSDAELAPGSLHQMLRFMEATPTAGIIGPKLIYPDGTVQFSCRRFPTIQGKALRQFPLGLRQTIAWAVDEEMQDIDRSTAQPVDYVIGACQMIRRDIIDAIGSLDERMFYGPEDVDFCLRAWRAGWEVYYVPEAVVVHDEQRITHRHLSPLTLRHARALAYYFWKHRYLWSRPARSRPGRVAAARVAVRPRVLELITLSDWGGAQQTVLSLARGMREAYDVTVACAPGGQLVARLRHEGIRTIEIPHLVRSPHLVHDLEAVRTLIRLMRAEQFDLVHCHSTKAGVLGRIAARIAGVPAVLFTAHGWQFVGEWPVQIRVGTIAAEWLASRLSTRIICVSEYDRQVALRLHLGAPDRVMVIHNGVDPRPWTLEGKPDVPVSTLTAVMVGRMTIQKDPETLLESWTRLNGDGRLMLVGDGPLLPELERRIRREGLAGRVDLLPPSTDIPSLLRKADVFVLSSRWEGLPLAIIEAMMSGLPVVATRVGGVPEVVVDGETGLLVPPHDPDALASALERVLTDPVLRQRMGDSGRRRALEHFTEARMLAETAAVYARLLGTRRRLVAASA